ncbi:MAG: sugar ABC transporter substrate-binding protein [Paenibacillaceae bacterium]
MGVMRTRRLVGILLTIVLLLGILAACSNNSEGDDKVTLRMIESLTSPNRTELLKAMLAEFEDQNPNIKVELISPPFDQADNKIRTMLGAEEQLDILEVRDLNVAEFVNNSYVEPINSYTDNWTNFKTMGSAAKSVGTVGDKLYFVPNGLYQRQMFYRTDWFAEKGLKAPTTWEELYETGKALTDPANNRYGFSFRGGPGSNGNTDTMILSYNGDKVDLDNSMFTKEGTSIFSTPEAKAAMELYLNIYKDASPSDSINWGFQEQVQAFTSGVTAILLQDPDVIQVVQEKMEKGTWDTAPMPTGPTGKALFAPGGAGWGITSYSEHKDEAWKLIAFLSSPEQNTQFSKDYGLVPIHSSATEDEFFKTGPYKTMLDMSNQPDTFVSYKAPFQYPGLGQWGQVSMESQQALVLGNATLDETLKKWDAYWVDQKAQLKK